MKYCYRHDTYLLELVLSEQLLSMPSPLQPAPHAAPRSHYFRPAAISLPTALLTQPRHFIELSSSGRRIARAADFD